MATPFTRWAALYTALLDIYNNYLTSGQITTRSLSLNSGGTSRDIQFSTADEIRKQLDYVKAQAEAEANPGVSYGRTFGKQGGTGRW